MVIGEKNMTLVIAAAGSDFIILGADSRGTMSDVAGNRIELNMAVKLIKITDNIAFLVYGDANISDYLVEKFQKEFSLSKKTVVQVTEDFAQFCRSEAEKVKDVPRDYFPKFGFIIAGLDEKGSIPIPRIFGIRSIDGFQIGVHQENFAIAGKRIIATYLFSKEYNSDMNVDSLSKLTAKAILDTSNIDADVGGEIKMARIDDHGFDPYTEEDIDKLLETEETSDTE